MSDQEMQSTTSYTHSRNNIDSDIQPASGELLTDPIGPPALNQNATQAHGQFMEGTIFVCKPIICQNKLIVGKFASLTLQLMAVLLFLAETPTVVIILAAFAYVFGFMEGVISLLRMIRK